MIYNISNPGIAGNISDADLTEAAWSNKKETCLGTYKKTNTIPAHTSSYVTQLITSVSWAVTLRLKNTASISDNIFSFSTGQASITLTNNALTFKNSSGATVGNLAYTLPISDFLTLQVVRQDSAVYILADNDIIAQITGIPFISAGVTEGTLKIADNLEIGYFSAILSTADSVFATASAELAEANRLFPASSISSDYWLDFNPESADWDNYNPVIINSVENTGTAGGQFVGPMYGATATGISENPAYVAKSSLDYFAHLESAEENVAEYLANPSLDFSFGALIIAPSEASPTNVSLLQTQNFSLRFSGGYPTGFFDISLIATRTTTETSLNWSANQRPGQMLTLEISRKSGVYKCKVDGVELAPSGTQGAGAGSSETLETVSLLSQLAERPGYMLPRIIASKNPDVDYYNLFNALGYLNKSGSRIIENNANNRIMLSDKNNILIQFARGSEI